MVSIKELLVYLVSAVISYHDSQNINPLITHSNPQLLIEETRKLAHHMIGQENLISSLQTLINECTATYPHRKPFLNYLANEIAYLHAQSNRKNFFNEKEYATFTAQMKQMFTDFIQLLKTKKSATYNVLYSKEFNPEGVKLLVPISLSGLSTGAYIRPEYCTAGLVLLEQVIIPCGLHSTSTTETIASKAEETCKIHQDAILLIETQDKLLLQKQSNQALNETLKKQQEEIKQLGEQNNDLKLSTDKLTEQNTELQQSNQSLRETNTELTIKIEELQAEIEQLKIVNREQQKNIETLQESIASTKNKGITFAPLFSFYQPKNFKTDSIIENNSSHESSDASIGSSLSLSRQCEDFDT